jgi:hypothetical protein
VENVDVRQTLLIFPIDFMRRHSPKHVAQFQELGDGQLLVRLIAPGEPLMNKAYKLVTSHEASWASIPRTWLRNQGARAGDKLDLFTLPDPYTLLLRFRPAPIVNP